MKVPPLNLSGPMDRLPLPLPFSPDLLWRYPLGFPQHPPPSPILDFKTQMPGSLAADPRLWSREDVVTFLHWCERDFDLPQFDIERFQMNGKALCLLTKTDLDVRAPGAGDVVHNALQLLIRDAPVPRLPSSPLTPTSARSILPGPAQMHPGATQHLSPHTPTQTSAWPMLTSDLHSLQHLIHQSNSVTLSPAPSVDSQQGSPQHQQLNQDGASSSGGSPGNQTHGHGHGHHGNQHLAAVFSGSSSGSSTHSGQSGSQSDSEDSLQDPCSPGRSPPVVAPAASPAVKEAQAQAQAVHVPVQPPPQPPQPVKEEAPPTEAAETNTNGRLLWDFLQQLLNDPAQRYCNYIAWKNREIGVFKIVDPPGLARLWGIQKNHLSMNYDKMSRALRYYYRVNILRKVQGERHCYQFLRNPGELKNIKNISLLRQQMAANGGNNSTSNAPGNAPKSEVCDAYDDMPTDLSMDSSERSSERNNPFIPHITIKTEDGSD